METTASGGVDRTVLRLSFEGHQPDIQAMRLLYDDPDSIEILDGTQESTQENSSGTQESKGESTLENINSSPEALASSPEFTGSSSETKVLMLLRTFPSITLEKVATLMNMTKRGVVKITNRLQESGRLTREGSTKSGRWIVINKD